MNISKRQCVTENPINRIGRLSAIVGKLCKVDPDTNREESRLVTFIKGDFGEWKNHNSLRS